MKVPTLDAPRLSSSGLPNQSPYLRNPDTAGSSLVGSVGRGLSKLASQGDKALTEEQAAVAKARKEASALSETDKLLEQQERAQRRLMGASGSSARIDDAFDGVDTSKGGFLATRGLKASESSAELIDQLVKDQKEISDTIADPEARARFKVKSREQLLAYRRQVESHASGQFRVAQEETVKARMGQAISMASAGVPDFESWHTLSRLVESDIEQNAPAPAVAEAQKTAFRAENGYALVTGMLAQGRVDEAKQYVEQFRPELGGRYREAQAAVDRAGAGAEKDRLIAEGAKLVDGTYDSLRMEAQQRQDEYVDPEQLRAAIKLNESDPGVRAEISAALERRIHEEDDRKKRDTNTNRDTANRADVERRSIPGGTLNWLTKYDPDFLLAREARLRAEARAAKAARSGDARERAAAKEQQKAWDLQYRYRLEARLAEEPTTKPADVLVELLAERARDGEDMTVSPTELERAGASSAKTVKQANTTLGQAKKKFTDEFGTVLKAKMKPSGRGAKVDDEIFQLRKGKAADAYQNGVDGNGGKPLDPSAVAALRARLLMDDVEIDPGTSYGPITIGRKLGMGVDLVEPRAAPAAPTAAPPAGSVVIRRKADGKKRTVSAAEAKRFLADPKFELGD